MSYPIISADSHITEPPNTYVDYIDAKWKDRAPRMQRDEKAGDQFVIDGMKRPVAMGLVAAAGKPPENISEPPRRTNWCSANRCFGVSFWSDCAVIQTTSMPW